MAKGYPGARKAPTHPMKGSPSLALPSISLGHLLPLPALPPVWGHLHGPPWAQGGPWCLSSLFPAPVLQVPMGQHPAAQVGGSMMKELESRHDYWGAGGQIPTCAPWLPSSGHEGVPLREGCGEGSGLMVTGAQVVLGQPCLVNVLQRVGVLH